MTNTVQSGNKSLIRTTLLERVDHGCQGGWTLYCFFVLLLLLIYRAPRLSQSSQSHVSIFTTNCCIFIFEWVGREQGATRCVLRVAVDEGGREEPLIRSPQPDSTRCLPRQRADGLDNRFIIVDFHGRPESRVSLLGRSTRLLGCVKFFIQSGAPLWGSGRHYLLMGCTYFHRVAACGFLYPIALSLPALLSRGKSGVAGVTLDQYARNRGFILPMAPIGPCKVLIMDQFPGASLWGVDCNC